MQRLTLLEFASTAINSALTKMDAVVPATNSPTRVVHLAGAVGVTISGAAIDDPSNMALAVEASGAANRVLVTGNRFTRTSGAVLSLGASTTGCAVVNNMLNGGTITDAGSGNTVAPNY